MSKSVEDNKTIKLDASNFKREEYCKSLTDVVGTVCSYCGRSLSFFEKELEKICSCGDVLWNYQQYTIGYDTCELRRLF
ncbi:MAG: hypothetical protein ACPKPY_03265 [Nitrososphaeraceae archaeon]